MNDFDPAALIGGALAATDSFSPAKASHMDALAGEFLLLSGPRWAELPSDKHGCVLLVCTGTGGAQMRLRCKGSGQGRVDVSVRALFVGSSITKLFEHTVLLDKTNSVEVAAAALLAVGKKALRDLAARGKCTSCGAPKALSKVGNLYCAATCWVKPAV